MTLLQSMTAIILNKVMMFQWRSARLAVRLRLRLRMVIPMELFMALADQLGVLMRFIPWLMERRVTINLILAFPVLGYAISRISRGMPIHAFLATRVPSQ